MADLKAIKSYIESHRSAHLVKVQEYLRQPSISAQNIGVRECAALLMRYYHDLGCQEVEMVETGGHPGLWAFYDAGAPNTIVNYCMYDVQPVEGQLWTHDPFAADLVEQPPFPQVLIARGSYNSKGPYRMWLNALESILAVEGRLPVNIMFIAEGEEELGSPHFRDLVARYADRLNTADAVLDLDASQDIDGKVVMSLGNKGVVYLELYCTGRRWGRGPQADPTHSSRKAVVDSPTWRLVNVLTSLATPDGNTITVDGLLEDVVSPSLEDLELVERWAQTFDEETWKREWGIAGFIDDLHGRDLLMRYLFQPSLNIDGLWSGWTGPRPMTIIPHEAACKIDVRLVPNMRADTVAPRVRAHLDRRGYTDIEIRTLAAYDLSKTSVREAIVKAILEVYERYDVPYEVRPFSAGSAPMCYLTNGPVYLPLASGGLGHGSRNHIADEYLVIDGDGQVAGLVEAEQSFVDILYTYAEKG